MTRLSRRRALMLGALATTAGGAAAVSPTLANALNRDKRRRAVDADATPLFAGFRQIRATGPDRSLVYDAEARLIATLTDDCRSAVFAGPPRTLVEPTSTHARVDATDRVLLAPTAWRTDLVASSTWRAWFRSTAAAVRAGAASASAHDAIAVAAQYIAGAPVLTDANGVEYAGDAGFGPMRSDGHRYNRADYLDYLGIKVTWPDGTTSQPDPSLYRYVDCSGFVRLVYGYRLGMRLTRADMLPGVPALPRYAHQIADYRPATALLDTGSKPPAAEDIELLLPGDLVFFAQSRSLSYISHCGMVIGHDNAGHLRFISSRSVINGPSFGDVNKMGILNGDGYYGHHLRRAIRL